MHKKGATQKILLYTFYLLMAFLIIYSSSAYLNDYFNGLEFNKEFITKDLGLAIDTLALSPNNIELKYDMSQEFQAESKDSKLKIKLKDLEFPREYNFISNIKDFSKKSNEITIKKDNGIIRWI